MSWFWRGAQSAFFYYVSCAPCANYGFERRRAKEKARAEKETKALMKYASRYGNGQIIFPGEYDVAAQERVTGLRAFTTNIYWQEERSLGPDPKRDKNRGVSSGNLDTDDGKENRKGEGRRKDEQHGRSSERPTATASVMENTCKSSLDTLEPRHTQDQTRETNSNPLKGVEPADGMAPKRYQRADEALWGDPTIVLDWEYYARGRNPDVNALCPPVVSSRPASANQARWMLQPPPSAKVMEGKQLPLIRPASANMRSRSPVASKHSWANVFHQTSQRPSKILLSDLGDRMTDLHEPIKEKETPKFDTTHDGSVDPSDVYSTRSMKHHGPLTSSEWGSPGRKISREKRPPPIMTSPQLSSSHTVTSREKQDLNSSWKFPRQLTQRDGIVPPLKSNERKDMRRDGYHSEPEPNFDRTTSQDLANRQYVSSPRGRNDEFLPQPSSKPTSSASQPQSDSASSAQGIRTYSSRSSLHDLENDTSMLPATKTGPMVNDLYSTTA